jgi:RNA polymerase sigma-70 factor, ECF subfamily
LERMRRTDRPATPRFQAVTYGVAPMTARRVATLFCPVRNGVSEAYLVNVPLPDDDDERQERFLSLFLPEQGGVRAFIRAIVWDRERCEDIFQEVALVLWRELDRYDARRSFGAWARGVAAKVALRSRRQARRMPTALSPEAIEAIASAFDELAFERAQRPTTSAEEALRHCLERLPERTQVLIDLRYRHALELTHIASRVNSSPEAVRKALSRTRDALQRCVQRRLRAQ